MTCTAAFFMIKWTALGDQLSWGPFVHGDQIFGDCLSRGTNFLGDHLSMGTNCLGDHLSMGTKWAGTVCSWGPIVGDQMSGDWMGSGPNEKQPSSSDLKNYPNSWPSASKFFSTPRTIIFLKLGLINSWNKMPFLHPRFLHTQNRQKKKSSNLINLEMEVNRKQKNVSWVYLVNTKVIIKKSRSGRFLWKISEIWAGFGLAILKKHCNFWQRFFICSGAKIFLLFFFLLAVKTWKKVAHNRPPVFFPA